MNIHLEAKVSPTEDPDRVRQAILNLFPDATETAREDGASQPAKILMTSNDFQTISMRIGELLIKDTARNLLLRSIRGNEIKFRLNRQAALSNRVNFIEGNSALGDIEVCITSDEPEAIARFISEGGK